MLGQERERQRESSLFRGTERMAGSSESLVLEENRLPSFQGMRKMHSWPAQGELILSVHVIRMKLDLYHFPDDSVHAFRFLGLDTGGIQQDTMVYG
jgi:hypothetical protein